MSAREDFTFNMYPIANLKKAMDMAIRYVDRPVYSVEKKIFTVLSIQDPSLFYVKLEDEVGESNESLLKNALNNFCQLTDVPEPNEVFEGLPVIVPDPENHGHFCRGEVFTVMEEESELINVELVDKGVCVEMPISVVKTPTTALLRIPKLAIPCRLDKLEPAGVAWDTVKWKEVVQADNSFILFTSTKDNILNVVITTDGKNLALKLMTELDLAKAVSPRIITDTADTFPRFDFTSWTDFKIPVYGICANSLEEACIQLLPELVNVTQEKVASYVMELSKDARAATFCKDVGSPCIAQYKEDELWYRAQILEHVGSGMYSVCFIDYGNVDSVHESKIIEIPPELLKFPVGATICVVADMEGVQGKTELEKFKQLIEDTDLHGEINNPNFLNKAGEKRILISLWEENGKNIASLFGCNNLYEVKSHRCVNDQSIASRWHSHLLLGGTSDFFQGVEYKGVIAYVDSMESIWLHLGCAADQAEVLSNELQNFYSVYEHSLPEEMVEVGIHCVAKQTADMLWYRAQVRGMSVDKKAISVLFVDYGNMDVVSLEDVKPLISFFAKDKGFALQTSLEAKMKEGVDMEEVVDKILDFAADKVLDITLKRIDKFNYGSIRHDNTDLAALLINGGFATKLNDELMEMKSVIPSVEEDTGLEGAKDSISLKAKSMLPPVILDQIISAFEAPSKILVKSGLPVEELIEDCVVQNQESLSLNVISHVKYPMYVDVVDGTSSRVDATSARNDTARPSVDAISARNDAASSSVDRSCPGDAATSSRVDATSARNDIASSSVNASSSGDYAACSSVDATSARNDAASSSVDAASSGDDVTCSSVDATSARNDAASSSVDAGNSRVDATSSSVGTTSSNVDEAGSSVDTGSTRFDAISSSNGAACSNVDAASSSVGATNSNVDATSSSVGAARSSVDAIVVLQSPAPESATTARQNLWNQDCETSRGSEYEKIANDIRDQYNVELMEKEKCITELLQQTENTNMLLKCLLAETKVKDETIRSMLLMGEEKDTVIKKLMESLDGRTYSMINTLGKKVSKHYSQVHEGCNASDKKDPVAVQADV